MTIIEDELKIREYEISLEYEPNNVVKCNHISLDGDRLILRELNKSGEGFVKAIYNNWNNIVYIEDEDEEE